MYTLKEETQIERVVGKSRFIALSFRVSSSTEAKTKLKEVRALFPQATHYCYAWRFHQREEEFFSDGGEPPGSAGRPILQALRSFQVTDAMVVVVRYFGGKKLGIPGLIAAYRTMAEMVLEKGGRREWSKERAFTITPELVHAAKLLATVHRLLGEERSVEWDRERGVITVRVGKREQEALRHLLHRETSLGRVIHFEERETPGG